MEDFDEKCITCRESMTLIEQFGDGSYHAKIYWCGLCGTLLNWNTDYPIDELSWKVPIEEGD